MRALKMLLHLVVCIKYPVEHFLEFLNIFLCLEILWKIPFRQEPKEFASTHHGRAREKTTTTAFDASFRLR